MNKAISLGLLIGLTGFAAHADYALSQNGKKVVCSADDNISVDLNAKRDKMKYTVEGESLGYQTIADIETDGKTFIAYSTEEFTLVLSDDGDTLQYSGDEEPGPIDCE